MEHLLHFVYQTIKKKRNEQTEKSTVKKYEEKEQMGSKYFEVAKRHWVGNLYSITDFTEVPRYTSNA